MFRFNEHGNLDLGDDLPTDTGYVTVNCATDTIFLTNREDPMEFFLDAFAATFQGSSKIRRLAVSHEWFERLEFNQLLDRSEAAALSRVPRYGRLLQPLSKFCRLANLDIIIGAPKRELNLNEAQPNDYDLEKVRFVAVDREQLVPKDFMRRFHRTFFREPIKMEICWAALKEDMRELFAAAKDGRYDTED